MSLKEKVKNALKWKKNSEYCAERLGITEEEFNKIKKEIYAEGKEKRKEEKDMGYVTDDCTSSYDIENGQGKITGISNTEPKSAEEIIQILNIDTTQWKLSQYWNKQMSDHWRISALITKLKNDDTAHIEKLLENWKPKKFSSVKRIKTQGKKDVCAVLSLQDIHFGKQGNETIDKDFEETIMDLVERSSAGHNLKKIFYVVGGDLMNMDSWAGTTTSGTPLDNCSTATEAYMQAFDAMYWSIHFIKQYCDELQVVYIPGNHDRLSSFHLAHALSKAIDDSNILWDTTYLERKVYTWGDNFFAFEHGDVNTKNSLLLYATEFAQQWGTTNNRTLFTGHLHHKKKVEYITTNERTGFMLKILPSLSRTDYWHYHNKFVGSKRSGVIELHDYNKGNICELTYSPD
jgi:hypothetical protein